MTWDGNERREGYIHMEERLRAVEIQLAKLNGSLPELREKFDTAVIAIQTHEANAASRYDKHLKCMVAREKATDNIRVLWIVITSILLVNAGLIITLLSKVFAR